MAWVMESVLPEKLSGEDTVAVRRPPVPFPTRRPLRVVEPVPPKAVERVVVPMTEPLALVVRREEAMAVMARLVVVARLAKSWVVEATDAKKLVVVAEVRRVLPVRVVEASEAEVETESVPK